MINERILVVDSDPEISAIIDSQLNQLGYNCVRAGDDAAELAAVIKLQQPTIAFVNSRFKETSKGLLSAVTFLEQHGIPVIFVAASEDTEITSLLKLAEPYGILYCPFDIKQLQSILVLALRRISTEQELQKSRQWFHQTFMSIAEGIITTDTQGRVVLMNGIAETLTGWTLQQVEEQKFEEYFSICGVKPGTENTNLIQRILGGQDLTNQDDRALLTNRNGRVILIALKGAQIKDENGVVKGAVLMFRHTGEIGLFQRFAETRLELIDFAKDHTLDELLVKSLDVVGEFVESPIGFYHFVNGDQKTLVLQQWSTRTQEEFCKIEGQGMHYPVADAGVWVDCLREGRSVIHNDYSALANKKGLPEGHAPIVRELVVPVFRDEKIVAILGVGNKSVDYTQRDVEIVEYLADVTWQIVSSKKTEDELVNAVGDWEKTFNAVNAAIWILDKDQKIIRTNKVAEAVFGCNCDSMTGRSCYEIAHGIDSHYHGCPVVNAKKSLRRESMELHMGGKWYEVVADPILDDGGEYLGAVHIVTDISERREREAAHDHLHEQLVQAQKMDSIGRLAGGIAHDFNNMLGVIIGYTEMVMERDGLPPDSFDDLSEVQRAAERSVDLVRQLLAFARKQVAVPKIIDLNDIVAGMLKMLRRLIGEEVELIWVPGASLDHVKVDPAQVHQILVNLCVNARDAINGTGEITIQSKNVTIGDHYSNENLHCQAGAYVMLEVTDDGKGIETETMDKIFEPFFTTKSPNKGTGLGLSTVYGIVKQNDGFIHAYSELGNGASFKVYLPVFRDALDTESAEESTELEGGEETILLVEDEQSILNIGKTILKKLGYKVLVAETPVEAIDIANQYDDNIDLLLTDVVMPHMNGKELMAQIAQMYPEIRLLYMSGYTSDIIMHKGILQDDVNFLQKPFSAQSLGLKVREVLS